MSPRDIDPRTEGSDGDARLVATAEMCHYCFDVLVQTLLPGASPASSSPTRTSSRSGGSPSRRRSEPRMLTASSFEDGGRVDASAGAEENGDRDGVGVAEAAPYVPPAVECPLFVTWDKRRDRSRLRDGGGGGVGDFASADDDNDEGETDVNFDLRGCIGTLAPRPLHRALGEFALTSALRDRRFEPIRWDELPSLRVGVSLLVEYEECRGWDDWVVGVHGIIISFEDGGDGGDGEQQLRHELRQRPKKQYSATYLPEVPLEQRWNHEEAVVSLVRKAGYRGATHDSFLRTIRCRRYQSSKLRSTYRDYVASKCGGVDPLASLSHHNNTGVDDSILTVDEGGGSEASGKRRCRKGSGTFSRQCINL